MRRSSWWIWRLLRCNLEQVNQTYNNIITVVSPSPSLSLRLHKHKLNWYLVCPESVLKAAHLILFNIFVVLGSFVLVSSELRLILQFPAFRPGQEKEMLGNLAWHVLLHLAWAYFLILNVGSPESWVRSSELGQSALYHTSGVGLEWCWGW